MALLEDILGWTQSSLTPWQRDAARRLFQQQNLPEKDFEELYALLRAAHGLPAPAGLVAVPLAAEHLPAKSGGNALVLEAIRDLKFVNRIAPSQTLKFSPKGITVIYGGNGSGKSGYSRVLKKACRARDISEEVLQDASDPAAQKGIPEATFEVTIGGAASSLTWRRGVVPPDQLSTVAVFDARCARIYLTSEQSVAYLPYGLDVVENLANKVLPNLTDRLNKEIAATSTDVEPFKHLLGDTAVGKMVSTLGAKTDPKLVELLATMSAAEAERLAELEKALSESDPRAKAKEVRLQVQRVEGLIKKIDAAAAWVSDAAIAKLKELDDSTVAALLAEKAAAEAFRAGETLLPGTGDAVWKELFEAARRYSTTVAYPGHSFPHTGEDASCVLCQQPLGEGKDRLQRFEDYIKQDAAKTAAAKRLAISGAIQKITGAPIAIGLDEAAENELLEFSKDLPTLIKELEKAISERRQAMLTAVEKHDWSHIPGLLADPRTSLKDISTKQTAAAAELDKAGDEDRRKALEKERAELRARTTLGASSAAIVAVIDRFKHKALLELCKGDLKTKGISDKSKEFSSNAVTKALKAALDDEFKMLGIGHIGTKLNERVGKGKTVYKILLDLPVSNNIEDILSEGEQRAIAIGSFLAELRLADHKGAVVFDDPVSSLDHWRRQNVAQRLADEAKQRQVIVFTHDTAFLGELSDAVEKNKADNLMQHLEWQGGRPGIVVEGLPWEHQSYKDRINKLEQHQKKLENIPWPAYPNEKQATSMRTAYSRLRSAIERVVQDVVFCGVVKRYRDWIRMDKLEDVVGFEKGEQAEIARLHKQCCDVTEAHDPSSAKAAPVPTAAQLSKDIEDLKKVIDAISARRKKGP